MSKPTAGQVVYASTQVSARLLENAASPDHEKALLAALRAWFPDRDQVDEYTLKEIAVTVRANLLTHRALLLDRLDRLVANGTAEPL